MHNALASLAVVVGGIVAAVGIGMIYEPAGITAAGVILAGLGFSQLEDSK
jgi:hypothetical protein